MRIFRRLGLFFLAFGITYLAGIAYLYAAPTTGQEENQSGYAAEFTSMTARWRANDHAAALRHADECISQAKAIEAISPGHHDAAQHHYYCLQRKGEILGETGSLIRAIEFFEASLVQVNRHLEQAPDNTDIQDDLSFVLGHLGRARQTMGQTALARGAFEKALAISRAILAKDPLSSAAESDVAGDLIDLYDATRAQEGGRIARPLLAEALDMTRDLAARYPRWRHAQEQFAIALERAGDAAKSDKRYDEAQSQYDLALETQRRVEAMAQKSFSPLYSQGLLLHRTGLVFAAKGDGAAARDAFAKAETTLMRALSLSPDDRSAKRSLAITLAKLSDTYEADKDWRTPLILHDREIPLRNAVVAANPNHRLWRQELARAYYRRASIHRRLGAADKALQDYAIDHRISAAMVRDHPNDQGLIHDLAVSLEAQQEVLDNLDRFDEAAEFRARAIKLRRGLLSGGDDPSSDGEILLSLMRKQANHLASSPDTYDQATALWPEAEALLRPVYETSPTEGLSEEFSTFLSDYGDHLLETGEAAQAEALFREMLEIDRGLAKSDPGNRAWARNVAFSLGRLAQAISGSDKHHDAYVACAKQTAAANDLIARFPDFDKSHLELSDSYICTANSAKAMDWRGVAMINFREARRVAIDAFRNFPQSEALKSQVSDALRALGETAQAYNLMPEARKAFQANVRHATSIAEGDPRAMRSVAVALWLFAKTEPDGEHQIWLRIHDIFSELDAQGLLAENDRQWMLLAKEYAQN